MRLKSLTGFLAVLFMQGVSLSGKGPQWADMARDGLIRSLAGNSLYPYKTRGGCACSGTAPLGFSLFAWRYLLKGEAVAVSAPCYKMSMASP